MVMATIIPTIMMRTSVLKSTPSSVPSARRAFLVNGVFRCTNDLTWADGPSNALSVPKPVELPEV